MVSWYHKIIVDAMEPFLYEVIDLLLTSHFFPTHTLLLAKTKGFKVFC